MILSEIFYWVLNISMSIPVLFLTVPPVKLSLYRPLAEQKRECELRIYYHIKNLRPFLHYALLHW